MKAAETKPGFSQRWRKAQFNQDPDKTVKLGELNGLSPYQRPQYAQDQGWATITGEDKPDRTVADAFTRLILAMIP